ncbi:MAG TPA: glycoside hydrolase [Anaerolineaceae bacterium]|nr:glycoside hydrolase [Anaerolineaceae bacterium]
MNTFKIKDNLFWLNDQPIFIQSGEFHYYRTPPEEWRHRLNLLKEAGFNTLASYIPWLWHQLEEDVSDFDGHSHPMRNLEGFLDLADEMGFLIIPRPGPYIMAETTNEGIPPWVFENYPGAAFIDQNNKVQNIASYLHPDFLKCVRKWYQAIFQVLTPRQITYSGKIIMTQLDNEMGMIHWVRNIIDTNPDTIQRFADYIRQSPEINHPERYPKENLEDYLKESILHPDQETDPIILEDYRRFFQGYLEEYAAFLIQEAKLNGMEVPPIINIHGFANGGKTFPIGLSQLIDVMRLPDIISATDVYPCIIGEGNIHELYMVNEMTKALQNPDQALFSIEFQSGGNMDFSNMQSSFYDLHARLCITSGMRAINHYLFFGGENHPVLSRIKRHDWGPPVRKDGSLRQHYHRYGKLSDALAVYGQDLVKAQPQYVTTIGFQLDYFMTEVNNITTQQETKIITHQRERILFDMLARGLTLSHRPFTSVDLDREALDPAQTPVLWTMMEKQCYPETQQKLLDYVKDGGTLIMAGRMCLEDFEHKPCTLLKDDLGITHLEDQPPFQIQDITIFDHQDVPVSFLETYQGDFAEVFAYDDKNAVVGFRVDIGEGNLFMLGAAMPISTLEELDIIETLSNRATVPPLLTMTHWVDARLSIAENGRFLSINNYKDDPVDTVLSYQGQPLFGGNQVHLPARQGAILPLEWQYSEDILIHYATSEIRHIYNEKDALIFETAQPDVTAELTVKGYTCQDANVISEADGRTRVVLDSSTGKIVLKRVPR